MLRGTLHIFLIGAALFCTVLDAFSITYEDSIAYEQTSEKESESESSEKDKLESESEKYIENAFFAIDPIKESSRNSFNYFSIPLEEFTYRNFIPPEYS